MGKINIAIDGPAGAGKSTVARLVAERLSYVYVDTGAMYRALTWKALKEGLSLENEDQLAALLSNIEICIHTDGQSQKVRVNNQDVTEEIRKRQVTNHVSLVASYPQIRQLMVDQQRKLAESKGVVMDGRDIGTYVLVNAEVKIFLSASIEERAKRRYTELKEKEGRSLLQLQEEIRERDERDMNREVAPLKKAEDAHEIDSTHLSIEQVVAEILSIVHKRLLQGEV